MRVVIFCPLCLLGILRGREGQILQTLRINSDIQISKILGPNEVTIMSFKQSTKGTK
jgi:hypothetical protein